MLLDSSQVWTHSSQKRGESPDRKNQDSVGLELHSGKIAISDGAAKSGLSYLWSKILVNSFIDSKSDLLENSISLPTLAWPEILRKLARYVSKFREISPPSGVINSVYFEAQRRWDDEIRARYPKPQELRWSLQNELAEGSYATILFAQLKNLDTSTHSPRVLCRALAVGDACVMRLDGGNVLSSFPLTYPREFNSRPTLVSTRYPPQTVTVKSGDTVLRAGNTLFLGTDSIAKWFLEHPKNRAKLLELVRKGVEIDDLIDKEIIARRLRNDDITFVLVQI